jgi:hypothetical protein
MVTVSDHSLNEADAEFAAFDAAPRETLHKRIDLVIVMTCEQLCRELLKPGGTMRKANRAAGKQVSLANHACAFVSIRFISHNID